MKILAVSDEENNILWSDRIKEHVQGTELIISCGDLRSTYLEFLVTMLNIPLLYVHGNHDKSGPEGGICIDGKIYCISGLSIMGLGGSMRYREGRNMYTEREMRIRIMKLFKSLILLIILLASLFLPAMPYLLAFAAGAMMYVVVEELIPEASNGTHSNLSTIGFALGFVLMMVLDVVMG